jgi:hypothetical protein
VFSRIKPCERLVAHPGVSSYCDFNHSLLGLQIDAYQLLSEDKRSPKFSQQLRRAGDNVLLQTAAIKDRRGSAKAMTFQCRGEKKT